MTLIEQVVVESEFEAHLLIESPEELAQDDRLFSREWIPGQNNIFLPD